MYSTYLCTSTCEPVLRKTGWPMCTLGWAGESWEELFAGLVKLLAGRCLLLRTVATSVPAGWWPPIMFRCEEWPCSVRGWFWLRRTVGETYASLLCIEGAVVTSTSSGGSFTSCLVGVRFRRSLSLLDDDAHDKRDEDSKEASCLGMWVTKGDVLFICSRYLGGRDWSLIVTFGGMKERVAGAAAAAAAAVLPPPLAEAAEATRCWFWLGGTICVLIKLPLLLPPPFPDPPILSWISVDMPGAAPTAQPAMEEAEAAASPFTLPMLLEEDEEEAEDDDDDVEEDGISCLIGVKVIGLRALWPPPPPLPTTAAATAEPCSRSGLSGTVTQLITFLRTRGEPTVE